MNHFERKLRRDAEIAKTVGMVVCMVMLAIVVLFFAGCGTPENSRTTKDSASKMGDYSSHLYTLPNSYRSPVVRDKGGVLEIVKPPELKFTGQTATAAQIRQWAHENGINAVGIYADSTYAQLEGDSAIQLAFWLKRALHDLGYTYYGDARDCDNFARIFRTFPDFFADDNGAQALVFGIYAKMEQPFAGVSDGYHALNAAWTDKGVPVFEPQGWQYLVFQDIRAWPNRNGITNIITD